MTQHNGYLNLRIKDMAYHVTESAAENRRLVETRGTRHSLPKVATAFAPDQISQAVQDRSILP
jgi:hypothetical protein